HDPAHRSREPHPAVVPAHRLPEAETADEPVDLLRQDIADVLARPREPEETVALLEVVDRDAVAPREARRGLLPELLGRPLDPLVRRSLGEVVDQDAEAARPDEDLACLCADVRAAEPGELLLCFAARRRG